MRNFCTNARGTHGGEQMRRWTFVGAALATTIVAMQPVSAADCVTDGQLQAHELAIFVSRYKRIKDCATQDGKLGYKENSDLLETLNRRQKLLATVCPASDARFVYVRDTLAIQT